MKVGIITYHNASNFGAVLQAFALQKEIDLLGANAEIIDYQNRFITKGLDLVRFSPSLKGLYYFCHDILTVNKRKKKRDHFLDFFNRYYRCSKPVSENDLKNGELEYDIGISGSDQIWNPLLEGRVNDIYYLNFPAIKKRCSYGSSFGSYNMSNEEWNATIVSLLSKYQSISVREGNALLDRIRSVNTDIVCDPTFLLDAKEWKTYLKIMDNEKQYVLIYALGDYENVSEIARCVSKRIGIPIISIGDFPSSYGIERNEDVGPREFVEFFANAKYIITNSFHGTVFSVLFRKNFLSVVNSKSPKRAESFLKRIELEDRLIQNYQSIETDIGEPINWNRYEDKVSRLREESIEKLKRMIC